MAEKTASEAPVWYSADEASAWANGYNACLDAQPQSPPRLSEDQIMAVIRKVTTGELREMLTCKRWKDGIDIDMPTFAAERLAEEFRAAVADTRPDRKSKS